MNYFQLFHYISLIIFLKRNHFYYQYFFISVSKNDFSSLFEVSIFKWLIDFYFTNSQNFYSYFRNYIYKYLNKNLIIYKNEFFFFDNKKKINPLIIFEYTSINKIGNYNLIHVNNNIDIQEYVNLIPSIIDNN